MLSETCTHGSNTKLGDEDRGITCCPAPSPPALRGDAILPPAPCAAGNLVLIDARLASQVVARYTRRSESAGIAEFDAVAAVVCGLGVGLVDFMDQGELRIEADERPLGMAERDAQGAGAVGAPLAGGGKMRSLAPSRCPRRRCGAARRYRRAEGPKVKAASR